MDQTSSETTEQAATETASGVLEITEKGYGFLRRVENQYRPTPGDVFVGKDFVRQGSLRSGLFIEGQAVPPSKKKGGPKLEDISTINGEPAEKYTDIIAFQDMVVVDPHPRLKLETPGGPMEMRGRDLI